MGWSPSTCSTEHRHQVAQSHGLVKIELFAYQHIGSHSQSLYREVRWLGYLLAGWLDCWGPPIRVHYFEASDVPKRPPMSCQAVQLPLCGRMLYKMTASFSPFKFCSPNTVPFFELLKQHQQNLLAEDDRQLLGNWA